MEKAISARSIIILLIFGAIFIGYQLWRGSFDPIRADAYPDYNRAHWEYVEGEK